MKRVLLLLGLVVTAPLILIAKVALFVPRLLRRKLARPLTADEEGYATPFDQLPLRLKLEGPFFAVPGQAQFEQVGEGGAIAISMFPSLSLEEEASLGSASGRRWVAELLGESVLTQGTTVSLREESSFVVVTREGLLDGARCIAGIVAHAAGLLAVQAAVHGEDAEQLTRSRRMIASVALTEAEGAWELARAETTTGKSFHHDVREVIPGDHLVALVATRRVLVAPDSVEGLSALRNQVELETESDPLGQRPSSHIFRVRADDEWEQVA